MLAIFCTGWKEEKKLAIFTTLTDRGKERERERESERERHTHTHTHTHRHTHVTERETEREKELENEKEDLVGHSRLEGSVPIRSTF